MKMKWLCYIVGHWYERRVLRIPGGMAMAGDVCRRCGHIGWTAL